MGKGIAPMSQWKMTTETYKYGPLAGLQHDVWHRSDGWSVAEGVFVYGNTMSWLIYPPVFAPDRHFGFNRRFKTAQGAMAAVDKRVPLQVAA